MNYQGLLYLVSGFSGFMLMAFIFRTIGMNIRIKEMSSPNNNSEDNSWYGTESLVVHDIIVESGDVKTFQLIREGDKKFPTYYAGQFLSFKIDEKNFRSYLSLIHI